MICFKCSKTFINIESLIQHIRHLHPFEQSFICQQDNCHRNFPVLNGLKKHLIKNHSKSETFQQLNADQIEESDSVYSVEDQNIIQNSFTDKSYVSEHFDSEPSDFFQTVQNAILRLISKMYSNSSLPRNIVQIVIEDIKELFNFIIACIEPVLNKEDVGINQCNKIYALFKKINNIFDTLDTEHKRFKFLEDNKYYIKPQAFFLGKRSINKMNKSSGYSNMIIQKSEGQIIELRKTLKAFLELPNVFNDIVSYMKNEESLCDENVRTSILQGNLWKELKLEFPNKIIIPLYLFCDDFEPNNPLGSKSGIYKVNAVYVSIASVPIQYTSLLENIFLTQVCFTADRTEYIWQ